jgi:hypothetical protein
LTPGQLVRIDFSNVPLQCANGPGEGTSLLLLTRTLDVQVKLTKAPPPSGKKPRAPRSQGSLAIDDLDSGPGQANC